MIKIAAHGRGKGIWRGALDRVHAVNQRAAAEIAECGIIWIADVSADDVIGISNGFDDDEGIIKLIGRDQRLGNGTGARTDAENLRAVFISAGPH